MEALRQGAALGAISFATIPAAPVATPDIDQLDRYRAEIVRRYRAHGFVLVQFAHKPWDESTVERLAEVLGLGEPFVPPLYTRGGYTSPAVSRIATRAAADPGSGHPHFETTVGQDLHCDGTLQEIGEIKSAILLCRSQGAEGGGSMVFNAHAAFVELLETDPAAARALTTPGVLVRQATFNGSDEIRRSPVFTLADDQVVCRYCVDATDRFEVPAGADAPALARGLAFLARARQDGSPYLRRFDLAPGEALVMDNTRISHGREAYRDGPAHQRCLYRSLHLRHPKDLDTDPVAGADPVGGTPA